MILLQKTNDETAFHNHNNKHKPDGQPKEPEQDKSITFPAFDLSTKQIGFGNGTNRVHHSPNPRLSDLEDPIETILMLPSLPTLQPYKNYL